MNGPMSAAMSETVEHSRIDYRVSGQPDYGKPFFLSYLLVRRLPRSKSTVYRESDEYCFLFDEVAGGAGVTADYLFGLTDDEKRAMFPSVPGVCLKP